jgi:hypothetical protein
MKLVVKRNGEYYCYSNKKGLNNYVLVTQFREKKWWQKINFKTRTNVFSILNDNEERCLKCIYKNYFFKNAKLKVLISENNTSQIIDMKFKGKFIAIFPLEFEFDNSTYVLESYGGHYFALFIDKTQVALFNQSKVFYGDFKTFIVLAEDNLNTVILFLLSIINDVIYTSSNDTFAVDFGQIGRTPSHIINWRPRIDVSTPTSRKIS